MTELKVTALVTLQFSVGGLFDCEPIGHDIHLVRSVGGGRTPGPTLCGLERFIPSAPGWSVGGGVSDPDAVACADCVSVRAAEFADLTVSGSMFGGLFS